MEQYKFPDEIDPVNKGKPDVEIDIELEDVTPPEDRGRQPMPKEIVEKLEVDELDKYDTVEGTVDDPRGIKRKN